MLEVKNLSKFYGEILALSETSLFLKKGERAALLGLNGAGKTTLFRIITGYLVPSFGECSIDGTDIFSKTIEARKKISYLPENPPLYQELKVLDYLKFICEMKQIPSSQTLNNIEQVCNLLDIENQVQNKIYTLSLGYKKRVGIAQALIGNPKLILMDEPISGLDPEQILEMRAIIQKIQPSTSILIASHILSELEKMCEKFFFLHKGKILNIVSKNELEIKINKSIFEITLKGKTFNVKDFLKLSGDHTLSKFIELKSSIFLEILPDNPTNFFSYFFKNLEKAQLQLELFKKKESTLEEFFLQQLKSR